MIYYKNIRVPNPSIRVPNPSIRVPNPSITQCLMQSNKFSRFSNFQYTVGAIVTGGGGVGEKQDISKNGKLYEF